MSYAADDTQAIAQRLKELQAERDQYLTGTSAPVTGQEPKTEELPQGYGYGGMCGYVDYTFSEEKLVAAITGLYQFGSQP
jgi:hypothetical protein